LKPPNNPKSQLSTGYLRPLLHPFTAAVAVLFIG
jgi:hypothetical protein